jgi:hypothetical protein
MGAALFIIVYLTNGLNGANMSVTQFDVRATQVFSSISTCQAAQAAVLVTPATAFEGKTARGNLGWWWLRVRGRHGP